MSKRITCFEGWHEQSLQRQWELYKEERAERSKQRADADHLQLENHKLHGECGHLQADVAELKAEIERLDGVVVAAYRAWVQDSGSSQFIKDEAAKLVRAAASAAGGGT